MRVYGYLIHANEWVYYYYLSRLNEKKIQLRDDSYSSFSSRQESLYLTRKFLRL